MAGLRTGLWVGAATVSVAAFPCTGQNAAWRREGNDARGRGSRQSGSIAVALVVGSVRGWPRPPPRREARYRTAAQRSMPSTCTPRNGRWLLVALLRSSPTHRSSGSADVRPRRQWLSATVTAVLTANMVGRGAVSLLVLAMLVGSLPVLFDIAPAQVRLPVMQLSRPAVCLSGPLMAG
jgi:hypothetical protein